MKPQMLFIIGAPRSGTTMLGRMLSAHSMVQGGREPHLLTPLAHLGVWGNVDRAPYDHVLAAESQRLFISRLPGGEAAFQDACRAYCDVLYGRYMEARRHSKSICLDRTQAYSLILPFVQKVFPDAKYVVATRHPVAMFSSYANSHFGGDYQAAHAANPIIERHVPALAAFMRHTGTSFIHVRYESLVRDPEACFARICDYIDIPHEREAVKQGKMEPLSAPVAGMEDPGGIRPARDSAGRDRRWALELAQDPGKLALVRRSLAAIDPADLETIGYPLEKLWLSLGAAGNTVLPPGSSAWGVRRLRRVTFNALHARARKDSTLRRCLIRLRLACDVLLRE